MQAARCGLMHLHAVQGVRAVAAGAHHTVAVTDGVVYAWGANLAGQLGTRTFRDKAAPTLVQDLVGRGVHQVACGLEHTLFLCRCAPPYQPRLHLCPVIPLLFGEFITTAIWRNGVP